MSAKALLISVDDWQGLYVGNELVTQDERIQWRELMDQAEKHGFVSSQIIDKWAGGWDEEEVNEMGMFPPFASELRDDYGYPCSAERDSTVA